MACAPARFFPATSTRRCSTNVPRHPRSAYCMSKFGLAGLTQSINAEERVNGVRACSIFPGDIDTPLLNKRPAPPDAAARAKMMQPEDIADCWLLAVNMP